MLLRLLKLFLLGYLLSVLTSCVNHREVEHKALAPTPTAYHGGVIQVYAARTWGAKEALAVHTWISTKKSDAENYTSYEIIGWRLNYSDSALAVRQSQPDKDWWGHAPTLLLDYREADVDQIIDKVAAAVESYPHKTNYHAWPGPNSNTFIAYIGRKVPQLGLDLPSTAIGKDYRELADTIGLSPSGTGVQISLLGLLSVTVGYEEGLELNLLGLNFELDVFDLAVELPGVGRVGADAVKATPN